MAKVSMEICYCQIRSNNLCSSNLTKMTKIELLLSTCMRVCRFLTSIELHVCGHLQISEDLKC